MQMLYLIGQILDIIGAIIIFIYSSIPGVNKLPGSWMRGHVDKKTSDKEFWRAKWYPIISAFGLFLVIIGFVLQIIPTFAKM